jgi:hypothetical protein
MSDQLRRKCTAGGPIYSLKITDLTGGARNVIISGNGSNVTLTKRRANMNARSALLLAAVLALTGCASTA